MEEKRTYLAFNSKLKIMVAGKSQRKELETVASYPQPKTERKGVPNVTYLLT